MEQFVTQFGIDWKLMVAQLINFAILVFILGKFVYKPILKALDNRRKKIEEGVAFSEKAKSELENIETMKMESLKKTEAQSITIVKQAEDSARVVRDKLVKEAEHEKEKIIASGKTHLAEEKVKLEKGFYQEAVGVLEAAMKKVLAKGDFKAEEKTLVADALKQVKSTNN